MVFIKKIIKKKIFWLCLIIALVVLGIIISQKRNNKPEELVTDWVKRGDLVQSVSATGQVESVSETDLNFKITGKLAAIYAKAGAEVKRGQLLAKMESRQKESAVVNAQAKLAEAKADLEKTLAGSSNEDIAVTQAKVVQVQADLASRQADLANSLEEKEQNILSLKEVALDTASGASFTATEALEDIDNIIHNGSYEDDLKNYSVSYNQASGDDDVAGVQLVALQQIIDDYSPDSSAEAIVDLLTEVNATLDYTDTALNSTFALLSVIQPIGNVTQANIDAWKSTINTDQSGLATAIDAAQTAKSNLQVNSVEYDNNIEEAEENVAKAESALSLAEAELNLKLAGPRGFEIDLQQARIKVAEASLQSALADLADYSLVAPLDGVITKVNYEVGEYVSLTEPTVSMIGQGLLEIEVDVPESDITKVHVNDEAKITLDAFGDDKMFQGHIVFIDPAETIISDVVYYKVKIIFDETDDGIKSGMTANIVITTNIKKDVLYIPLRAVIEKSGEKFIRVIANGVMEEKPVTIGLRGDGGLAEVISGLAEGQEVVTYINNGK